MADKLQLEAPAGRWLDSASPQQRAHAITMIREIMRDPSVDGIRKFHLPRYLPSVRYAYISDFCEVVYHVDGDGVVHIAAIHWRTRH